MERAVGEHAELMEMVSQQMVRGKHFGTITVAGKETKPTLFKAGAELVIAWYGLRVEFVTDGATLQMMGITKDVAAFHCYLQQAMTDGTYEVVAEGRGAASLAERAGKIGVNGAIKIAQKRAMVDAVLRLAALSEEFTQDLEDDPSNPDYSQLVATNNDTTPQWWSLFTDLCTTLGYKPEDPELWKRVGNVLRRTVAPGEIRGDELPRVCHALVRTVDGRLHPTEVA